MQVDNYIFNPRYVRYVKLQENDNYTNIIVELTGGETSQYKDRITFTYPIHKDALQTFKYCRRKMEQ